MPSNEPFAAFNLALTGRHWYVGAGDTEVSPVVAALGKVMSLSPAISPPQQFTEEPWRELRVITDSGKRDISTEYNDSGPVFCLIPPSRNKDRLAFGMSLIALAIARAELSRGGLLIHGALAALPNQRQGGIILAGPGTVGKTTASNRLPPPWRSLSDDATLVVRDDSGQYWAHPWPTWSSFFRTENGEPGPGGKWDVQEYLLLKSIYFLKQSNEDQAAPLSTAAAMAYLMETVQLVSSLMTCGLPANLTKKLHRDQITAVEELICHIPSYALHLTLTGTFWKNIENTLSQDSNASCLVNPVHVTAKAVISRQEKCSVQPPDDKETITVCYFGPSMNPTLRSQDILEVIPYAEKSVQPGDIVYYTSPTDGQKITHRIVRVTEEGIYTSGDNNSAEDSYVLQQKDIIGRVSAAWRHGRYRIIAGSYRGIWSRRRTMICRRLKNFLYPLLHETYTSMAKSNFWCFLLPTSMKPRVFKFNQRYLPAILKLIVNGHVIGHYDPSKNSWFIKRPWKLIADESKLAKITNSTAADTLSMNNEVINHEMPSFGTK